MPIKCVINVQVGDALGFIPAVAHTLMQGQVLRTDIRIDQGHLVRRCGHPNFWLGVGTMQLYQWMLNDVCRENYVDILRWHPTVVYQTQKVRTFGLLIRKGA
ncbi:hypothetical protein BDP81DRAFT_419195 [Colletotrichum phormii]|uniref:Uncharacterized protein n=1 Tax=Colletotrichum phormii TaxID=359342 RepID=A0AAJ0EI76_9PEZI|nr:uncharacterized protein BDP81DRAFT_419195 [Colletotrichum phormii]KAK1640013.1 hypothetical protein BDP81DRAFT_419195 [Colletotrichum phormii]